MTFKPTNLIRDELTNSLVSLYTVPVDTKAQIKSVFAVNRTPTTRTFDVHMIPSGGSADNTNLLVEAAEVGPNSITQIELYEILEAGGTIEAQAAVNNAITLHVDGAQSTTGGAALNFVPKSMVRDLLSAALVTKYTATAVTGHIRSLICNNVSGATRGLTVHLVKSGDVADNSNLLIPGTDVFAFGFLQISGYFVLEPGGFISAKGGVANDLMLSVNGGESS